MKLSIIMLLLVSGCASNNNALKSELDAAEATSREQAAELTSLQNQIESLKKDQGTCEKVVQKLHEVQAYLSETYQQKVKPEIDAGLDWAKKEIDEKKNESK